jgi:hypothetical protein
VYRRRRVVAIGGSAVAAVLLVWLLGAFIGKGEPTPPRDQAAQQASTPPSQPPPTASPSSSATSASAASPASPSPPAPPPPPPGPPQPCPDTAIGVTAEVDKPSYESGQQPNFTINVVNTGQVPCTRDIGRHLRELVVMTADGANRLWSSNDCYSTDGVEVRVMQPGEKFPFSLRWLGTTSEPGCGKRTRLGAGDYLLIAKLGGVASSPVVFRIT